MLLQKKAVIPDLRTAYREASMRYEEAEKAREQKKKADDLKKELALMDALRKAAEENAELDRIREFGAKVITQELPSYPKSLREIHPPPIVLYV